jgi:hypothetical protein
MSTQVHAEQKGIIYQKNYIYYEVLDIKGPRELTQEDFEIEENLNDIHEIKELSNSENNFQNNYMSRTYQPIRTKKNIYEKVEIKLEGDPSTRAAFNTFKPNRQKNINYGVSTPQCQRWSGKDANKSKKIFGRNKKILCPDCEEKEKLEGLCNECRREEEYKKKMQMLCDECRREEEKERNKCLNKKKVLCNECKREEENNNYKKEELLSNVYKSEEKNIIESSPNNEDGGEQIKIGYVDAPFLVEKDEDNKALNDSDRKDLIDSILKELDKEENIEENTSLKIAFKVLNEKDKKLIIEEIKRKITDEKQEQKFNNMINMLE